VEQDCSLKGKNKSRKGDNEPRFATNNRPRFSHLDSSKVGETNMDMSLQQRFGRGPRALLVGLSVLGCFVLSNLVLADASYAIPPAAGLGCQAGSSQATNGKITGRGSSFNAHAEALFAQLYEEDVCGATPEALGGPAGNTMVAYNYPAAEAASATGAKFGLQAAACRTDAYAGDATPYTEKNLEELDAAPATSTTGGGSCALTFTPPFEPTPGPYPDKEAGQADTQANIMSFPITGEALALIVNLPSSACTAGTKVAPTNLDLTAKQVSRIYGGDAQKWNDAELVNGETVGPNKIGANPLLANCEGAISRVVREDSAAQSEFIKKYLVNAEVTDGGRGNVSGECAVGKEWSAYLANGKNTEWPGLKGTEGTCSKIKADPSSGGPEEVKTVEETPDGVGYADLADAVEGKGLITASVESATNTGFQSPQSGSAANCNFSTLTLPSGGENGAVGLNAEDDNWANNNEATGEHPNHENATDLGSRYPICALAFDLVYTGLDDTSGTENAITKLTNNQRRTLYSYFTYVLSSTAQDKLTGHNYAPLPSSWLPLLTEGFESNF
jgi:ABC-type phosphate transport system substrate-binding protein